MNRTAKTVIAVQGVIIFAFVAFITWAAFAGSADRIAEAAAVPSYPGELYPGVLPGTSAERIALGLDRAGIAWDDADEVYNTAFSVCAFALEDDGATAFRVLDNAGYSERDKVLFYGVAVDTLCPGARR